MPAGWYTSIAPFVDWIARGKQVRHLAALAGAPAGYARHARPPVPAQMPSGICLLLAGSCTQHSPSRPALPAPPPALQLLLSGGAAATHSIQRLPRCVDRPANSYCVYCQSYSTQRVACTLGEPCWTWFQVRRARRGLQAWPRPARMRPAGAAPRMPPTAACHAPAPLARRAR